MYIFASLTARSPNFFFLQKVGIKKGEFILKNIKKKQRQYLFDYHPVLSRSFLPSTVTKSLNESQL